jgi:3-oxo-5-alpha-steroid 4-dehydrogenase 3
MSGSAILVDASVVLVWPFAIVGTLLTTVMPSTMHWMRYGKLAGGRARVGGGGSGGITVPKAWFSHFYLFALCWAGTLSVIPLLWAAQSIPVVSGTSSSSISGGGVPELLLARLGGGPSASARWALVLFAAHAARRVYECAAVHVFSPARMHVTVYIGGLAHYVFVPLTIVLGCGSLPVAWRGACGGERPANMAIVMLGGALAVAGNVMQNRVHAALAGLRTNAGGRGGAGRRGDAAHLLPVGPWFAWVSSPHYSAEVLIYVGLALVADGGRSLPMWALVAWVFTNLSVTALNTHAWYAREFGAKYPAARKAIIPFIL